MRQHVSQKIAKNSISNTARFIFVTLVIVIITPYTLHKLGSMQFGVWALTGVLYTYAQLSDFGISQALIKFVAELDAKKEIQRINEMISTALALYLLLGAFGVLLFLLLREILVIRLFHIPMEFRDEARFVFTGAILVSIMNLIFSVFESILKGLQRMELTSTVTAVTQILSALGVFIMLESGYGLKGLILKNAVIAILLGVASLYLARRVFPSLRLTPALFRMQRAKEILRFGANIQAVNMVVLLLDPFNKILLSNFLSLNFVTYYEVASRIISQVISFFQALADSIYPAVAEIQATRDEKAVSQLHLRSIRYLTLFSLPVFTLVVMLAHPFIRVWLGAGYETSASTLQILAIAWFVSMLVTPAYLIARGIGSPHLSMYSSLATGMLSVFLSVLLITTIGYYGAVLGNALSIILGSILMFFLFHRVVKVSFMEVWRAILTRALVINLFLATLTYFALMWTKSFNLLELGVLAMGYLAFYGGAVVMVGYFDADDKRLISQLLPVGVNTILSDRSEGS